MLNFWYFIWENCNDDTKRKKGMILGSGCLNNCYGVGDSRVFWLIVRFEMGFMVNARRIERKVLFFLLR